MKLPICILLGICLLAAASGVAEPSLTIYDQDFAIVRDSIPLDLKSGITQVRFAGTTAYLEPSSVILRDPSGKRDFQVLEQNYRSYPVSQELLLGLNEGKTIQFEVANHEGDHNTRELINGKIIRSGYKHTQQSYPYNSGGGSQPIIEVNGTLRFSLPGQPIFPKLADDTILEPTLLWLIQTDRPANFEAELSYVTGGMRWDADYNLVLPERGDTLELVGWVTMANQSGKSFDNARIKLVAGDVSKIQTVGGFGSHGGSGGGGGGGPRPVTERAFDEYHLYALERPATLHDQETKQVEFVRGTGVKSAMRYVYDGAAIELNQGIPEGPHIEAEYRIQSNKKVWAVREFTNSTANHLGLPLPKGRMRFYRRDTDGHIEFTGENVIDHTPLDEVIRVPTGNAYDLVGERKQTKFNINLDSAASAAARSLVDPTTGLPLRPPATPPPPHLPDGPWIDESFEINLRNHKKEAVEIRVVEHLYRWVNWELTTKSHPWLKTGTQTIEALVHLRPGEEKILSYTVHYSW